MALPKEAAEAAMEALRARDSLEAGKIVLQGDDYLPKVTEEEPVSTTRTFFRPLRISAERAAKLFSADRKKLTHTS